MDSENCSGDIYKMTAWDSENQSVTYYFDHLMRAQVACEEYAIAEDEWDGSEWVDITDNQWHLFKNDNKLAGVVSTITIRDEVPTMLTADDRQEFLQ